jgi:hypothetical protein
LAGLDNTSASCHRLLDDLTEYVGYSASKDMMDTMRIMKFDEILSFKQSLEKLLTVIISERTIH